ncbi:hypothetical protein GQ53DRAFT_727570 [Thozetella sp. PMI_491]|nr:hypothetical protein GQ53DRAFT_727570 [Thozetella sp. PMI_491]
MQAIMSKKFSASEVLRHKSPVDAWLVVNGKVLDMTSFAPKHPGGSDIIYKFAGRDASEEYNSIHAPSLLMNLPLECHLGILDDSTINNEWIASNMTEVIHGRVSAADARPELDDIINLEDFEKAAESNLTAKSWAFIHSGSNDNITREANNSFLRRIWLCPAVMRNVSQVDTRTRLFGCDLDLPIFISPTGAARMGGAEGELTLARAASSSGIVHCFATPSSYPHEEILDATLRHAFFQLYVNKEREKSEAAVRAVVATGKVKAIFVTVDVPMVPKREEDERVKSAQTPRMAGIQASGGGEAKKDKKGSGLARQASSFIDPTLNWEDIAWLRSISSNTPIVVKGIQRAADAKLAMLMGCHGIVLSNHGGRAADNAPPAILTLLELNKHCPEVLRSMDVLVDGGFRRGSDVVKAICLGASAVGFGRPFLYALGYGQEGVEHAVSILKDEIETAMKLCGITNLMRDASPDYVNTNDINHLVPGLKHPFAEKITRQSRL